MNLYEKFSRQIVASQSRPRIDDLLRTEGAFGYIRYLLLRNRGFITRFAARTVREAGFHAGLLLLSDSSLHLVNARLIAITFTLRALLDGLLFALRSSDLDGRTPRVGPLLAVFSCVWGALFVAAASRANHSVLQDPFVSLIIVSRIIQIGLSVWIFGRIAHVISKYRVFVPAGTSVYFAIASIIASALSVIVAGTRGLVCLAICHLGFELAEQLYFYFAARRTQHQLLRDQPKQALTSASSSAHFTKSDLLVALSVTSSYALVGLQLFSVRNAHTLIRVGIFWSLALVVKKVVERCFLPAQIDVIRAIKSSEPEMAERAVRKGLQAGMTLTILLVLSFVAYSTAPPATLFAVAAITAIFGLNQCFLWQQISIGVIGRDLIYFCLLRYSIVPVALSFPQRGNLVLFWAVAAEILIAVSVLVRMRFVRYREEAELKGLIYKLRRAGDQDSRGPREFFGIYRMAAHVFGHQETKRSFLLITFRKANRKVLDSVVQALRDNLRACDWVIPLHADQILFWSPTIVEGANIDFLRKRIFLARPVEIQSVQLIDAPALVHKFQMATHFPLEDFRVDGQARTELAARLRILSCTQTGMDPSDEWWICGADGVWRCDQTIAPAALQRHFTRVSKKASDFPSILGLPKSKSRQDGFTVINLSAFGQSYALFYTRNYTNAKSTFLHSLQMKLVADLLTLDQTQSGPLPILSPANVARLRQTYDILAGRLNSRVVVCKQRDALPQDLSIARVAQSSADSNAKVLIFRPIATTTPAPDSTEKARAA